MPVRLNLGKQFALTFLNFGRKEVDEEIDLEEVLKVDKARVRGISNGTEY